MTKDEIQALVDEMACAACFSEEQIRNATLQQLSQNSSTSLDPDTTGEVIGVTGGITPHVTAFFTRPGEAVQYSIGDHIANSQTAADVTPLTFAAARFAGGSGRVTGARCVITPGSGNLVIADCQFDLLLFRPEANIPFAAAGYPADNGVLSITAAAYRQLVGIFSFTASGWRSPSGSTITAGVNGWQAVPLASIRTFGTFNLASTASQNLLGILQAKSVWNPGNIAQRLDFAIDIEGN